MWHDHARLVNRMLVPAGVLLILGTLSGVTGYLLMPDPETLSLPAALFAGGGLVLAVASGVEAVRALVAYQRWLGGRDEACQRCGGPVVAPYLALLPYRCVRDRSH
ncbi:hypothetical protein [Aquisalimonas asiatica]|uniref:Uncharacterized protein n=1 Tax=Aquisalimonas asiatica TaxID=406100 RepID=A0A1H8SL37_9GAMM|nr:hypothetical protein [Aquisalimonas asiatica]SEO79074.1 hypothetical protein SAMN04488052_10327 [Aquisalimonas asiatica]